MVNATRVLTAMRAGGTRLNLVVLDACRDNPFPGLQTPGGETGLSQIQTSAGGSGRGFGARDVGPRGGGPGGGLAQMQAPEATVIAFATQPGDVAMDGTNGDSPFTVALVQALQAPGLDVLALFNQVGVAVKHATGGQQQPWISSSPIEGSYFLGDEQNGGYAASMPSPSGPPSAESARVRTSVLAEAAPRSIPVPTAIQITPPAPDVPPQLARFVGAWGPGRWQGRLGSDDFIVVVNDIDRTGQARLTIMNSSGYVDPTCSVRAPFIGHSVASMQSGRLTFVSSKNGHAISFWLLADNQLAASQELPKRDLTTSLQRIE
jgi:Caspase domain